MSLARFLRVCVVGSGPGGMYTAKYLLKSLTQVQVDVIEALPTPYGLVRFGVAPDHQDVKSVQNDFNSVMNDERVSFFGNVKVGVDLQVDYLRRRYDAVVLAYGANSDNILGIKGEAQTSNVFAARAFVNWYNGHPAYANFQPNLNGDTAIIVGQGNVAIDCARILTKPTASLRATDITAHALEVLATSNIKNVKIVGRRGHGQASFTIKELRELTKLEDVGCVVHKEELDLGSTQATFKELSESRPKRRINDLLFDIAQSRALAEKAERQVEIRFLLAPREIISNDEGAVDSIVLERTALTGEAFKQTPVMTGELVEEPCSLLLRSIGYKSIPLPGVPFDETTNTALTSKGRIVGGSDRENMGKLYASGWLKRGPTGIIGTNISDAKETVEAIVEDVDSGILPRKGLDLQKLDAYLQELKLVYVDWNGYKRIEQLEHQIGESTIPSKPREKIVDIERMLVVAQG